MSLRRIERRMRATRPRLQGIGPAAPEDQPVGRAGEEFCAGDQVRPLLRSRGRRRRSSSDRLRAAMRGEAALAIAEAFDGGDAHLASGGTFAVLREGRAGARMGVGAGLVAAGRADDDRLPPTDRQKQSCGPSGKRRRPSTCGSLPGTPAGRSDQSLDGRSLLACGSRPMPPSRTVDGFQLGLVAYSCGGQTAALSQTRTAFPLSPLPLREDRQFGIWKACARWTRSTCGYDVAVARRRRRPVLVKAGGYPLANPPYLPRPLPNPGSLPRRRRG